MSRKKKTESDEVEELLRIAEDDVLLKLSLNSHLKSDQAIDSDLDKRLQSLKSRSKFKPNQSSSSSKSKPVLPNQPPSTTVNFNSDDTENPDFDGLLARFAALKGTLPSSNSSSSSSKVGINSVVNQEEDVDEEDEVDKIIRWAVDAARLDPSPRSENDDDDAHSDDDGESDDDETDDDYDLRPRDVKKKGPRRK